MTRAETTEGHTPTLIGCDGARARRAAKKVLAALPWEGQRLDPRRTSAERFLAALRG